MAYAGVLPVSINESGEYSFLLGMESTKAESEHSNAYSDFGGGIEQGESILEAAARECYEESMGMLGTTSEIRKAISNNTIMEIHTHGFDGTVFFVDMSIDTDIPIYFNRVIKYLSNCQNICPTGYLEKTNMKWFSKHELVELYNSYNPTIKFRPNVLHNIVTQFIFNET